VHVEPDKIDGKHAFVTGGTGFTGGALCKLLLERGYEVTALVRKTSKTEDLRSLGVRMVVGDLREPESYASALTGVDIVFHIAAAFREVKLSDQDYWEINVEGTQKIIEAADAAGVKRFVHCSTIGVHGDTGSMPATEESPFAPPDFYCKSKVSGELLARDLFERSKLEGVVFRPVGIYGPGDTRFLKLFKSISQNRFVMIGSGEILYHLTYIDDLCNGILMCGEKEEAIGEVFIIGGDSYVTLNQLVAAIAKAVQSKPPKFRIPLAPVLWAAFICEKVCRPLKIEPPIYPRRVEFFSKNRAFDISKARRILGYQPQVALPEGLARTADWYRRKGML